MVKAWAPVVVARVGYHNKRSGNDPAPIGRMSGRSDPERDAYRRTAAFSMTSPQMCAGSVPAPAAPEPPSKTQRKHRMHALQELGAELVLLDPSRLAKLDLPEALADAIALARRLTRHEAKRRQMQYIGRLMRDVDPQPLVDALARWSGGARRGSGERRE
jgi:hypothetical protein